ncbi:hypothetical protein LR48_Vigan09g156500 [Vigna angularis]|uniref:C2 domain-containing protein n=1 Tax=Phaseolus angularis TaxID=3914 RepID=A0A0L9VCW4_PHAAN|nr:hypothetical protein LR48_Vigan09g156500 [Vigna angularis]
MGGCFSDMKGGKQAVGGIREAATGVEPQNDAVDFFYKTQGFQQLFTRVELSLSASNLLDRDITSKSDPMVVVFTKKRDGQLEELGRTEVIMNCLNPEWIEKISVAFQFEIVQPLEFHVYDIDTKYYGVPAKTLKLRDQEFIGMASCTLSEIVTKQSRRLTLRLENKSGNGGLRNLGAITVHAEETVASRSVVEMVLRCSRLDNKDVFSKSDPFLRISRVVESGGHIPICKTEVINDNLNPKWRPVCLGGHKFGNFTASNGNPQLSDSLHYIDPHGRLNSYQKAIMEVGEVIQFYDSDRRFPTWGFGGKMPGGTVSHCFNLNGSSGGSEVVGVEGIMDAYGSALRSVTLSGPTLFGPVINTAAQIAGQSLTSHNNTMYYVLLIITDGVVTDFQETINALVKASDLPLSILIVGVGNADFTSMEALDADNGRRLESSTGRAATRDIVQFVSMREVQSGQVSVVQALLEELPEQFLSFMQSRDVKPQPRPSHFPQASTSTMQ